MLEEVSGWLHSRVSAFARIVGTARGHTLIE